MSKPKHTRGPWRAIYGRTAQIHGGNHWIATLKCESCPAHEDANARLIAEAPAMYEALRAIVDDLQGLSHEPTVRAILDRIEEHPPQDMAKVTAFMESVGLAAPEPALIMEVGGQPSPGEIFHKPLTGNIEVRHAPEPAAETDDAAIPTTAIQALDHAIREEVMQAIHALTDGIPYRYDATKANRHFGIARDLEAARDLVEQWGGK